MYLIHWKVSVKLKIVPENIKIDVDGNELKVINGMLNILDDKNLKWYVLN